MRTRGWAGLLAATALALILPPSGEPTGLVPQRAGANPTAELIGILPLNFSPGLKIYSYMTWTNGRKNSWSAS